MTTILFDLREEARLEHDQNRKLLLSGTALALSIAIEALANRATRTNLIVVNGLWAHACRLLKYNPPEDGGGGHMPVQHEYKLAGDEDDEEYREAA